MFRSGTGPLPVVEGVGVLGLDLGDVVACVPGVDDAVLVADGEAAEVQHPPMPVLHPGLIQGMDFHPGTALGVEALRGDDAALQGETVQDACGGVAAFGAVGAEEAEVDVPLRHRRPPRR